jgi:thymidylate kinase
MFICFVGIDGSGKTLQAQNLVKRLEEDGTPCDYVWCRYSPRLLAPLIRLAKRMLSRNNGASEYKGYVAAKRKVFRRPVLGWFWLNFSMLEYLLQVTWIVRRRLRKGRVLVCDRYIYDMIADLSISLGRTGEDLLGLARHPLLGLFPMPDRVFFLDVPAEVAFRRKDDPNVMGEAYLTERAGIYSALSDGPGLSRIDGTKSIEEIADTTYSEVLQMTGRAERAGVHG